MQYGMSMPSALPEFMHASAAKLANQEAQKLANAAKNAQGALQWGLAERLYNEAADVLPRDPHTNAETIQAQCYRRAARTCKALLGTSASNRLIKDNPEYGLIQRQMEREAELAQNRFWEND